MSGRNEILPLQSDKRIKLQAVKSIIRWMRAYQVQVVIIYYYAGKIAQ